ncbi:hypothetical protein SRABI70_03247 [Pseudomonas sp. Bi70]|nr:hypothetical protein SRABI70_03247 [Pseudomonas sp. Bi70]
MFSSVALASFEPAPGPATTQVVFADTEPATLAPRLSNLSLAISRLITSRLPVSTQVWPASGRPSTTFFSLSQCMPKSRSCASIALARSAFSALAKNSRTDCLAFSLSPFMALRSSQSADITPSRLLKRSARFFAPVAATKGMLSLSSSPPRVVLAANSAASSPWSCSSRPRLSRCLITVWLCSSSKKL